MRTLLIAITVAALGLSGAAQAQKRSLTIGTSFPDIGKLDPHLTAGGGDKALLNWVFNGLVRIRPGESNPEFIEPDLAESWSANADGTEWTFKLRSGVQCHHGYGEFTAQD